MRLALIALIPLLSLSACKMSDEDSATGPTPADLDAIQSTTGPSKRSEILAGAHPGSNSILIFGGNDGPVVAQIPSAAFRKDTWIFEPGYGWTQIEGSGPSKRGRYALSVDHENNRALLFGGRYRDEGDSGDYDLFNDLWEFSFDTRTWNKLDNGNNGPDPRYYANSAWDAESGKLYVWGGMTNTSGLFIDVAMDLWAWNGSTWEEVSTGGDEPSTRGFLVGAHDTKRNSLVIFGGQQGDFSSLAYNETYSLNLNNGNWKELNDGQNKAPSTRMHGSILYDDKRDQIILFGGHTDVGDMNDLWTMNPDEKTWNKLYIADKFTGERFGCIGNESEVPADYVTMDLAAPERRHRGMFALMWDSLWVFGGMHAECSDHLNDTWRYDLNANTWHELIPATAGEACLRAGNDCECLCL